MAVSKSQLKAQAKYDAETAYKIGIKLNRKTDADLIEHFEQCAQQEGGKQGYIKRLIREDIQRKQAEKSKK